MSDITYISGHKNPDTDSICSAIAYSELENKLGQNTKAVKLGEINEETKFALEKFSFEVPETLENAAGKKLILVDHNEAKQSPDGIEAAKIIEIVDHHKFNFKFSKPIKILTLPLGSTCTIIAQKYEWQDVKIDRNIAGVLVSGILSDTVVFKSPTTTEVDIEVAKKMAQIAGIDDLEKFGIELKKKKASLKGKTENELITSDMKEFDFNGKKVAIGQIEVVENDEFDKRRKEFVSEMRRMKDEKSYNLIGFMVTNIIDKTTEFVCLGEVEYVEKAFEKKAENDSVYLENVMSRKKDIVPKLEKSILVV